MDRDEPKDGRLTRHRLGQLARRPITYETPEGPLTISAIVSDKEAFVVIVSPKGAIKIQPQPEERS